MNLNKINEFGCDESTAALYGYNIIVSQVNHAENTPSSVPFLQIGAPFQ